VQKSHTDKVGYDLPEGKNKRSAGFGIGQRFQTPLT